MNEKSNKLISLLTALETADLKKCRKFLDSPYFNSSADLTKYFDIITKRLAKNKPLDKRDLWAAVHGKSKPFNDTRFRKFTSDLYKLVREFVGQEALQRNEKLRKYLFLSALEHLNPDKIIRGVERRWDHLTAMDVAISEEDYLYRHLFEQQKHGFLNYERRPYDRANIEEISNNLDVYYYATKLRLSVDAMSRRQNQNQEYHIRCIDEIVNYIRNNSEKLLDKNVTVALAFYMHEMYRSSPSDDHSAYKEYKLLVLRHTGDLSVEESYYLLQPALNYCRRRIMEGEDRFNAEYLELYKFALPRRLLFEEDVLDPLQFKNTVMTALRLKDYSWVEHYIYNYQSYLPDEERENAVNYNLATLYFYQGDYDRAQDFLVIVQNSNSSYYLAANTMLLAIYYEQNADRALDPLMDSLSAYLNRHKEIGSSLSIAYRNLIRFTRRLSRLIPGDKTELAKIRKAAEQERFVASRPWLLEKIAELEA